METADVIPAHFGVMQFFRVADFIEAFDPDFVVGQQPDAVAANAFIEEPPVVHAEMVFKDAVPEHEFQTVVRHDEMPEVMFPEVVAGDKGEEARADAEIKIHADMRPAVHPAAIHKDGSGRERRPPQVTVGIGMTPDHPGRGVVKARHPEPARG